MQRQRIALISKLEQLEYEARKASNNTILLTPESPGSRRVGTSPGNEKLEKISRTKQKLSELQRRRYALSSDEEAKIRAMARTFPPYGKVNNVPPN